MTDRIEIHGIRVQGHHGVLESERRDGQPFVVDVVLETDTSSAAASDDLAHTVDYAVVAQRVAKIVGGDAVDLIETLATRVADACLAQPSVTAVEVAVHKPEAPVGVTFDDVVVRIRRERTP